MKAGYAPQGEVLMGWEQVLLQGRWLLHISAKGVA